MRPAAEYDILRIEKGKAREAATLRIAKVSTLYGQPSLLVVVAAIFVSP